MELWERAQSVDKRNSKAAKDSFGKYAHLPKRENPYGSLLRCADCGRVIKYVRSYSPKGDKAYYNYKCPENIELGDSACPKKNIRAQDLDTVVLATLQKQMELYLDTQKVLHRLIALEREKKKRTLPAGRIEDIRREIEKRKNLSTAIYTDYKEGLLTRDEYLYAKKRYQDELSTLEQELSELRGMDSKAVSVSFGEKHWQNLIDRYYGATELTGDMVSAMVREIRLHANRSISVEFLYMNEFEALIRECERLKKEDCVRHGKCSSFIFPTLPGGCRCTGKLPQRRKQQYPESALYASLLYSQPSGSERQSRYGICGDGFTGNQF